MALLTYFLEYHQPRRVNDLFGVEIEPKDGEIQAKRDRDNNVIPIDWSKVDPKILANPGFSPNGEYFLWEKTNEAIFRKVADKCYKPANRMLADMVDQNPNFKIAISTTGVMLEQAMLWDPQVVDTIDDLIRVGRKRNQVEMLSETYYHSVAGLFHDPELREFQEQVEMHKKLIYELFKVKPTSFRNTEHFINNRILDKIQSMGYHITLCEYRPDMDVVQHLPLDHPGRGVRTHKIFKSINGLTAIPRDRWISDGPGFRFGNDGEYVTADNVAAYIANIAGEVVGVFIDGEHIGEHKWVETGIFNFYWHLPKALARYPNIKMAIPSEVAGMFYPVDCPIIDIDNWSTSSWADKHKDTRGWLESKEQYKMFVRLEGLEPKLKKIGGEPLKLWRYLTTSCNLHNCYKSDTPDGGVHDYFSAYDNPDHAITVFRAALDYFDNLIKYHATRQHT